MQPKPETMTGKLREELLLLCDAIIEEYTCRGCGSWKEECDCPPPDPREALYDDPARGAR